jgi:hypothetical protein
VEVLKRRRVVQGMTQGVGTLLLNKNETGKPRWPNSSLKTPENNEVGIPSIRTLELAVP